MDKLYLFLTKTALAQGGASRRWGDGGGGVDTGGRAPSGVELPNPLSGGITDIGSLLERIVDYLFTISIPIVAIMVLVGGFQILFAAGDVEKFKKGRNTILYAVIGFAIILVAKGVAFIIRDLLGAR